MNKILLGLFAVCSLLMAGCNLFGPKTAEPFTIIQDVAPDEFNEGVDKSMHEITILRFSPGAKYLYAEVREGDRTYWIATRNQEIKEGETYLYNEALLKTQFESKELDRVYDTLYMVTALISKEHGTLPASSKEVAKQDISGQPVKEKKGIQEGNAASIGKVTLSDLFKNPDQYEGKIIEIRGTCTKVSNDILGRNWVHVNDGVYDKDLVVTLQQEVVKGETLTIEGLVQLNVDLGSGYTYDILLEEGIVLD